MIAKIYPDGHPDLQGRPDPTHPVRYFDIRKLTPTECYRLMGVPDPFIALLMTTEKRPYTASYCLAEATRNWRCSDSNPLPP